MKTRKMISVGHHISLLSLACGLILIACNALTSYAQDENPQRGFYPGGSYSFSDIEKYNTVNGNLILNIPIGALPPGRAGLSAGVNLIFNSKLWDTSPELSPNCANQLVTQNYLYPSFRGGWQYSFQYQPDILVRSDGAGIKNRIEMAFPDGSVHTLRPQGFTGPDDPSGYYAANYTNMTWYSTDGSYFRVQFGSGSNFYNTPWTIYFSDGSRVTGGNAPQRIYDRNNNYVEFQNITWNSHPAHKIVDQLGRHIIIEKAAVPFDPGQDYIHSWGVGGQQITWTIKWKSVAVGKTYRTVSASNSCDVDSLGYYLWVVDQIILPSQAGSLSYSFGYNAPDYPGSSTPSYGYGEVSSITLPTGAQASYSYSNDGEDNLWYKSVLENRPTGKTLSYQREYDGSSTQVTEFWGPGDVKSPDGGLSRDFFYPLEGGEFWKRGLVYKSEHPNGTIVERIWQTNSPSGASNVNPYVKTEFTSVKDAGGTLVKTAIKDFIYDKNGNVTRVTEYDWVDFSSVPRDGSGNPTGIPSGLIPSRLATNTYYSPTPDASDNTTDDPDVYHKSTSPNLCNAIASTEAQYPLTGYVLSRAEFFYDNAFTTGNLIAQKSWDSTKGVITRPLTPTNSISVTYQYDSFGNRTLTTNAKGIQTQFIYDPINGHGNLYVTQTKVAAGAPVQRWTTQAYDFNTSLVTQSTDMDNNVTTQTTYDVFGRPTTVKEAVGTSNERWTRTEYDDQARRLVVRAALNAADDQKLVSIQHYDQLGRVRLTRQLENPNEDVTNESLGIKTQTRYYAGDVTNPNPAYQNAYQVVSNPYRAATSSAAGSGDNGFTMGWARMKLDKGKRVIETQTFGADLPLPWGTGSTGTGVVIREYNGEITTVTDQAGKKRRSQSDALGRLIKVTEDPDGLSYETLYLYDALGNLRKVTQGAQTRWFAYSSLSRLIRVKNPEQNVNGNLPAHTDPVTGGSGWAMAYSYDANGNLTQRIDARGVVANYSQDALNRNTGIDYINGSQTSSVRRVYDGAVKGKGRFFFQWTQEGGANATRDSIESYDALGRPLVKWQNFGNGSDWGTPYVTQQAYDLAGNVKTVTYPSGRTVNYSHDQAGRLSSFSGNLGDGANRNYAAGMQYDASGSMKREQFGAATPLYHRRHYNNRGQLFDIRLGTDPNPSYDSDDLNAWAGAAGSWNRGALKLYYSTLYGCHVFGSGGTDNNGSPSRMDHHIPLNDAASNFVASVDRYDYDPIKRIKSVTELSYTQGPSGEDLYQGVFRQAFLYDRWGNRTIDQANTTGGVNNKAYTVDAATNRLTSVDGAPMSYDAAGNQTNDGSGQRTYDGESRMVEAYNNAGVRVSWYVYDAAGRRVVRTVGSQVTWQVYGMGGELLAEYVVGAAPSAPQKEYGYRNGELLITAEGGSSGSMALAKPAPQPSADLGGKADQVVGGAAVVTSSASGPVVALGFNEGSGSTTADASGNNNTGTLLGGATWTNAGKYGKALSFDGGSGVVRIPDSPTWKVDGLTGYSMSMWVKVKDVSGDYRVALGKGEWPSGDIIINKYENTWSYGIRTTDWYCGGSTTGLPYLTTADNTYHHIAVSMDASAGQCHFYSDGQIAGTDEFVSGTTVFATGAGLNNLYIGGLDGSHYINADIDEVRIYTVALTQAEIQTDMNTPIGGAPPGDTTPPIISSVTAGSIATTSATITWATNENSDSQVEYGTTTDYDQSTTLNTSLVTVHSQGLSGLTAGTLYHYRVKSKDAAGNLRVSGDFSFTTAQSGSGGIKWLVMDHLGSTRMVVDESGSLAGIRRHDFLPFGEELFAGVGIRSASVGYSADSVRQKFERAERDIETGLDLMGARYYASAQGRFTSPDPLLASGRPINPQSWNRYSFVLNRPLNLIDPSGLFVLNTQKKDTAVGRPLDEPKQDPPPPPTPPKTEINDAIDSFEYGGYTYETTTNQQNDLSRVYVTAFQNTWQAQQEADNVSQHGGTTPQSVTVTAGVTNTVSTTNTTTLGIGAAPTGASGTLSNSMAIGQQTATTGQVSVTSSVQPNSAPARTIALSNAMGTFLNNHASGTTIGTGTPMTVIGPNGRRTTERLSTPIAENILLSVTSGAQVKALEKYAAYVRVRNRMIPTQ